MPFDLDMMQHLAALFHIHKEASGHPKLKAIADDAMKQLEEHAKGFEPEQPKPAEIVDTGQDIAPAHEGEHVEEEHTDAPAVTRRGVL